VTTLTLTIGASSDDAYQGGFQNTATRGDTSSATMFLTGLSSESPANPQILGSHGGNDAVAAGFRFTGVTVPQGTTITSAVLTLTPSASYTSGGVIAINIGCQYADNPTTFTSSAGNLNTTARPRTTAFTGPTSIKTVTAGTAINFTITTAVQEVINRAGFASGNAIVVIADNNGTTTTAGEWQDFYSFDVSGVTTVQKPTLTIVYTAGGSFTGTIAVTPAAFVAALSGNAGEQGSIAVTPAAFVSAASGTFTSLSSGTITAAPAPFVAALSGNAGEQGTISVTPAPFVAALSGTYAPAGTSGTITATPAAFTVAASGNAGTQGTISAAPAPFTSAMSGTFTSLSSGTIAAAPSPFVAALAGNAGNQGSMAVTPAPFVAALSGTYTAAGGANPPQVQTTVGASGSGANDFAPTLVRDSSNRLWLGTFTASSYGQNPGNQLRIYKADTTGIATSYTEQDTAHRPANVGTLALAIDGSDLIHVVWQQTFTTPGGVYYQTFNTSTGLWVGTATKIGDTNWATSSDTVVGDAGVSLALDASGVPHVLYMGRASTATPQHIQYVNKVGGTWSSPAQIDTATLSAGFNAKHPNMMFDSSGNLHATWMTFSGNYDTGGANGTAYYAKRTGTTWQATPTAFAELLLGSIDNGPSLYVDPADVVHITYGLGAAGVNPIGEAVTGTTVDNKVFYRFSADGGTTWNTTTQPAHFVTHDPALGPDGAGGVFIWSHAQPTTVDGVGHSIGHMHRPKGSATWDTWTATTSGVTSADSTISTRHAQYFHNFPTKLDVQYFGDTLPATAYVGSDVPSIIAVTPAPFIAALSGTVTGLTTGMITAAPSPFTSAASGTFTSLSSGTITAAPSPFIVAASGNAGEQGTIAATPAPFVVAATGSSVGAGVSGTIAAIPAPFVAALTGTNTQPPITGTIVAIPGLALVAAAGSTTSYSTGTIAVIAGTVVTTLSGGFFSNSSGTIAVQPGPVLVAIVGHSGAITVYGTVTLTDEQVTTITLTDEQVTTITLTDEQVTTITLTTTDEEGITTNSYLVGNVARLNAIIKDITGINVDAGAATISAKPPLGTFTPVAPTHDGTGTYHYDYAPTVSGVHALRIDTTSPQAAAQCQIYVIPSLLS
jgi:hypothetical protein